MRVGGCADLSLRNVAGNYEGLTQKNGRSVERGSRCRYEECVGLAASKSQILTYRIALRSMRWPCFARFRSFQVRNVDIEMQVPLPGLSSLLLVFFWLISPMRNMEMVEMLKPGHRRCSGSWPQRRETPLVTVARNYCCTQMDK